MGGTCRPHLASRASLGILCRLRRDTRGEGSVPAAWSLLLSFPITAITPVVSDLRGIKAAPSSTSAQGHQHYYYS